MDDHRSGVPGRREVAMLTFAGWALCSTFMSIQVYLTRCNTTRYITLAQSFEFQMPIAFVLTAGVLWAIRISRRWQIERSNWRGRMAIHFWYCTLFTIVVGAGTSALDAWFKDAPIVTLRTLQNILYGADRQISIYLAVLFITHTWEYYSRFSQVQLRASMLQTELANSKLELLKSQIHPHFLFNALNTISSVISENPVLAERIVARLGQFLRATLVQTHTEQVPLEQELDLLDAYLDIQRLRFEEHLLVVMDIDPSTADALVPALLLQPIVENAIKYGMDPRGGRAVLTIAARAAGGDLMITVRDRGGSRAPTVRAGLGIGLANTRSRLHLLYGDAQSLEIERSANGFLVSLRLPLVREIPDALEPPAQSEVSGSAPLRMDPSCV
jgi:anti-sigma regulatory factor (Ser/Thr protein kinase)